MRVSWPMTWQQFRAGKFLLILLVLLIFKCSFLVGFFASFPDAVLHDRVLSEVNSLLPAGNRLDAETVSLDFPLQLQIEQARLSLKSSLLPELTLSKVTLRPTISTLFGNPGLCLTAQSDLGELSGAIYRSGEVDLQLRAGRFNLPFPEMPQLHLSGVINTVALVGQLQGEKDESVRFNAILDELLLTGAKQLGVSSDDIPLGKLSVALSGSGRALQIEQLSLTEGAVTVTGAGKIVVQRPFDASRLDLKLSLRPEASAAAGLRTLLELLAPPARDGSHAVQLRGRLLAPQLK